MVAGCFIDHCKIVHNWGKHPCPHKDCKYEAYSEHCFKIHINSHSREKNFDTKKSRCDRKNCGRFFHNEFDLKNHLRIHDNDLMKCLYCQWTGIEGLGYKHQFFEILEKIKLFENSLLYSLSSAIGQF